MLNKNVFIKQINFYVRTFLLCSILLLGIGYGNLTSNAEEINPIDVPKIETFGSGGSYYKFFKNSQWKKRSEGWTLSITPNEALRSSFDSNFAESAWRALYDYHKNDNLWSNTSSMKKQFMCHFWKAKFKTYWNIEPWKTSTNIICN